MEISQVMQDSNRESPLCKSSFRTLALFLLQLAPERRLIAPVPTKTTGKKIAEPRDRMINGTRLFPPERLQIIPGRRKPQGRSVLHLRGGHFSGLADSSWTLREWNV